MLRKYILAAAAALCFASTPAFAGYWSYWRHGPWVNYDGYYPVESYVPSIGFPYGYPFAPYADITVPVPVVTYAPAHLRVYTVPLDPPYYNVPPYAVYAPY